MRNLATSTLVGQLTSFKTSVIESNLGKDEKASVQVVVDEIWNTFDIDQSGALSKDEVRRFVIEYMPEFKLDFKFTEQEYEQLFKEVDLDGNGDIDKYEMAEFLTKILNNNKNFGE